MVVTRLESRRAKGTNMKPIDMLLNLFERDPERRAIRRAGIDPNHFYAVKAAAEQAYHRRREAEWPEFERRVNEIVESWPDD
jgi:hypothetical protein